MLCEVESSRSFLSVARAEPRLGNWQGTKLPELDVHSEIFIPQLYKAYNYVIRK